jgi:hypothetical protein
VTGHHNLAAYNNYTDDTYREYTRKEIKKVKLSLCLINYTPYHENVWGSGRIVLSFLISALGTGGWSASRPDRFIPRERAPTGHCTGDCVGPRTGMDVMEKKLYPCGESNPARPARHCTNRDIPATRIYRLNVIINIE